MTNITASSEEFKVTYDRHIQIFLKIIDSKH